MSAVEDVLIPYVPIVHEIDLPFPVSVNRLYRAGKGHIYKSPEAKKWIVAADNLYLTQKRGIARRIEGPFTAILTLAVGAGLGDADNRWKATLDWAKRAQLIRDDRFAQTLTVTWVDLHRAPHGCRLILREIT